jgi:sugar lactone lactonase YvrE
MSTANPLVRLVTSLTTKKALVSGVAALALLMFSFTPSRAWANGTTPVVTPASAQLYFSPVAVVAHGKYVWVADNGGGAQHHGAIYRIDIATGKTVPIFSPLLDDPMSIFSDGTDLWIANGEGGTIYNGAWSGTLLKLNIATSTLSQVVSKAVRGPKEMTSNGRYLWILNGDGGSQLTRMNIATGEFTTNDSLVTAGEGTITSDKTYVWVGGARLLRISKATDKIKVIDPKRLTDIQALVSDGTHLWVRWGNRDLVEMDIATGTIKSIYNPMFESAPNITTNGRYLWMSDSYDKTVLQFDATTGKVTEINSPAYSSRRTAQSVYAVTSEGTTVWVTVSCNKLAHGVFVACGTVQKITP